MKSKVALVHCKSYQRDEVEAAVKQGIELLGGVEQFAKAGEKVFFKPNLLTAKDEQSLVVPNAEVLRAVVQTFAQVDAEFTYGDSPGHGKGTAVAKKAGYDTALADLPIVGIDLEEAETVSFPEGNLVKKFEISKDILAADGVISVSKMKSHALTRMTGAIKNQFGVIPGARKAEFHGRLPDAGSFSKMLIDLNQLVKPRLFIMDGVIAMEGNGPANGTAKEMHVLLFSTDAAALDATVCRMMNLDIQLVETLVYAKEFGFGNVDEDQIEIVGDPLESFIQSDYDVNRSPVSTAISLSSKSVQFLMRNFVTPKPVILADKCVNCGQCVRICPAEPKAVNYHDGDRKKIPSYHYSDCIRCYCCQEMCPHEAIIVETPLIGKIVRI